MPDRTLIAVVDEAPSWLAAVGATLSSAGFHALLLGDGASAAERIVRDEPVLAILPSVDTARALREALGDACPALVLVTDDLGELSEEDELLFQAAYERPVPLDRMIVEARRAARGRKLSGSIAKVEPSTERAVKVG